MGKVFFGLEGHLRTGWKVTLFFLATQVGEWLAYALFSSFPRIQGEARLLPDPALAFLACLGVTWAFLYLEGKPLASIGLRLDRRWARQFAQGTLGGIAIMAVTAGSIRLAGGFHLVRSAGGWAPLLTGGWLYLTVALSEELAFRGYLFQRLEEGVGTWATQALVAAFFAMSHLLNPGMAGATLAWAMVNIALASLLLGLCYLKTRSLALPMGLHLGWNWTQGSLLGFGVSGTSSPTLLTPVFHGKPLWLTGGPFGLEASLPCVLVCGAACLVLLQWQPGPQADPGSSGEPRS